MFPGKCRPPLCALYAEMLASCAHIGEKAIFKQQKADNASRLLYLKVIRKNAPSNRAPGHILSKRFVMRDAVRTCAALFCEILCCFTHPKLDQHPTRSHRPLSKTMPDIKGLDIKGFAPEPAALPSCGGSAVNLGGMT